MFYFCSIHTISCPAHKTVDWFWYAGVVKDVMKVVGCLLEYDGSFVLLHRRADKPQGGRWGLPGGKVDLGERLLCEQWSENFKKKLGMKPRKIS